MIHKISQKPIVRVVAIALFLPLVSCVGGEVNTARIDPTVMERIAFGDGAILDLVEPDAAMVADLRRQDESWPYALGRAYEARGLTESARHVFVQEMEQGDSAWAGWSAARLARIASREQRWLVAESYARNGIEIFPENRDVWYRYGEALYRQNRYRDLLDYTDRIPAFNDRDNRGQGEDHTALDLAAERLLWRAVAAYQLEDQAHDRFLEAFTGVSAQPIHTRLFLYLYYRDASLSGFQSDARRLLEAVYRSAAGEHAEARRLFRLIDPEWFVGVLAAGGEERNADAVPPLIVTLRQSASGGDGGLEQWLRRLEDAASDVQRPHLVALRGTYAEARGDRSEARRLHADVVDLGHREYIRDWVQISIRAGLPLPEVLETLNRWTAHPAEYSLAVDRLLPAMIRDNQWSAVEEIYHTLPPSAGGARAQLAVVTVLAARDGHLPGGEISPETRLAEALVQPATDYYGLLARRLMRDLVSGGHDALLLAEVRDTVAGGDRAISWPGETPHAAVLLTAGLPETAHRRAMSLALDPDAAEASLELARRFSGLGRASAALDLARRAVARGSLPVGEGELPLLYPRPFSIEIRAAAEMYDVSPPILYGLIREESHFNPRARSPVGAVGLAQVMPATADDLVRRLGWSTVDLESVTDSVRMGAFYLDYLADTLPGGIVLQLAAYNAGPGRSRSWHASFGELSPELQVEALPFIETRWYVRRIAVSSAWYRYLIDGTDPDTAIPLFD